MYYKNNTENYPVYLLTENMDIEKIDGHLMSNLNVENFTGLIDKFKLNQK